MPDSDQKRGAFQVLVDRILDGKGIASAELRGQAFADDGLPAPVDNLISKVVARPARAGEADFAAAQAAGYSEDQLFELVICAAVGQSTRLYYAGLTALAEAVGETGPDHAA